ncbi:MAG: cyclic nucleotide-binding domain-containing protein [Oligoflexia bacterium]|nr:cyclic nucleotide-binding domain-containing protein [Oligoflexia bacterium]
MSDVQQLKTNINKFTTGTTIVYEKEISRKMYIVVKGKVRVYKNYMGQKVTLAVLGEGEIFGELSFIDAEPRSASVEALSDVFVAIIDGDKSLKEIETLPKWVLPVMKTVFQRFREADQRIAILENMYEFQKKNFKQDKVAQTIYNELLRFFKTLKIIYMKMAAQSATVSSVQLYKELDDILGKRVINLRIFWKSLVENNFLDASKESEKKIVELHMDQFSSFISYMEKEVNEERYLILNHSSLNILKKIIIFNQEAIKLKEDEDKRIKEGGEKDPEKEFFKECDDNFQKDQNDTEMLVIKEEGLKIQEIPFVEVGLSELAKLNIVNYQNRHYCVNMQAVLNNYVYQSFLKSFDHTIFSCK